MISLDIGCHLIVLETLLLLVLMAMIRTAVTLAMYAFIS